MTEKEDTLDREIDAGEDKNIAIAAIQSIKTVYYMEEKKNGNQFN